jgi:riboflavin biosynthesis pyrimidine reductase
MPVTSALARSARETPTWVMAGEDAPKDAEAALIAQGVEVFRVPFFSPPPCREGAGVGGGTPPPRPSPSGNRVHAGFRHPIEQSKSTTADFDGGEGEEVAVPHAPNPPANGGRLDLMTVLRVLNDHRITRLMVEGGPTIAAAFLAADLVDEAMLLRSPNPIGPDGIDALEAMPLAALTASPRFRPRSAEFVGEDFIETFERM